MRRVAYLTTQGILSASSWDPSEVVEHRAQMKSLWKGCQELGIDLHEVAWDRGELDPSNFEAVVIGTTWDYAARATNFLARLEQLAAVRPLYNSIGIVRWNIDKTYLRDLEGRGVPIVPTLWRARAEANHILSAFEELQTDHLVIKPTVGQTAWRQVQLKRGQALPEADRLPPQAAMLQVFQPAILTEGELSFVFIDGAFSHCVRKLPAKGDYRIQGTYGGTEQEHTPQQADLRSAQAVLEALEEVPLYARIDMLRDGERQLRLMECELIEPYLYPRPGCPLGQAFARGLDRRLRDS